MSNSIIAVIILKINRSNDISYSLLAACTSIGLQLNNNRSILLLLQYLLNKGYNRTDLPEKTKKRKE